MRAGVLLGLAAGFEVWAVLGAVVLLLTPHVRAALKSAAIQGSVSVALFLPFVLAGDFRMFEYRWRVNGDTLLSLVMEPGTEFAWPMRLAQGIAAVLVGALPGAASLALMAVVTVQLGDAAHVDWLTGALAAARPLLLLR